MIKQRFFGTVRPAFVLVSLAALGLSACGSDKEATQLPRIAGEFVKSIGAGAKARLGSGKTAATPAAGAAKSDPNAVVKAALAATPGPIAVVLRESNKAVTVMSPVESNAGAQTWMSGAKHSLVLKGGVIVATRGLGDDLMAAKAGEARRAISARRTASYARSYDHLSGLGYLSKLKVSCTLAPEKTERLAIGEINTATTVMKESCSSPIGISFDNSYWVNGSGRIVKSRQWISQGVRHVVVQPLR